MMNQDNQVQQLNQRNLLAQEYADLNARIATVEGFIKAMLKNPGEYDLIGPIRMRLLNRERRIMVEEHVKVKALILYLHREDSYTKGAHPDPTDPQLFSYYQLAV